MNHINYYNQFINESILDKMTGYSEEDIKNNFFNGKINIIKYIDICNEAGWKKPTSEEVTKLFLDGFVSIDDYVNTCRDMDWKLPSDQVILEHMKNENPNDMLKLSLNMSFFKGVKQAIEQGAVVHEFDADFIFDEYNHIIVSRKDDYEIMKLILEHGAILDLDIEFIEKCAIICDSDNKMLINIIKLLLEKLNEKTKLTMSDIKDLLYWCEENKNNELLNIVLSFVEKDEYIPPKKKWYDKLMGI